MLVAGRVTPGEGFLAVTAAPAPPPSSPPPGCEGREGGGDGGGGGEVSGGNFRGRGSGSGDGAGARVLLVRGRGGAAEGGLRAGCTVVYEWPWWEVEVGDGLWRMCVFWRVLEAETAGR